MKRRWMAISATTMEALMGCIGDECLVISVEPPLLDLIRDQLENLSAIGDYDIMWYNTCNIAILKKVRGASRFDDEHFHVYHYFLRDETY